MNPDCKYKRTKSPGALSLAFPYDRDYSQESRAGVPPAHRLRRLKCWVHSRRKRTRARFYGFDNRKNKFPLGEVMVMLFVPLAELME